MRKKVPMYKFGALAPVWETESRDEKKLPVANFNTVLYLRYLPPVGSAKKTVDIKPVSRKDKGQYCNL